MRVILFGGSFDPPHIGHVLAVAYALSTQNVDEALVVPVFAHAFDKDLAPFEHRVEMARIAFGTLSRTTVSTVEATLGAPSLTVRTLEHLTREHPDWELRLLVGADVLLESSKWTDWSRIEQLARPVVLGRANIAHPEAPSAVLPDISSTRIRALLGARSGADAAEELSRTVPREVLRYVDEHGLYS